MVTEIPLLIDLFLRRVFRSLRNLSRIQIPCHFHSRSHQLCVFWKDRIGRFCDKGGANLVIIGFVDTFCTTFAKVGASGEISGGKFGRVNVGEMGHFFFFLQKFT
jgi:hypothetical protein